LEKEGIGALSTATPISNIEPGLVNVNNGVDDPNPNNNVYPSSHTAMMLRIKS
jgi:hypothetical protein